jgi:hypothetical protein
MFMSSPEFRDRLAATYNWSEATPVGTRIGELTIYVHPDDAAVGAFLRKAGEYEPDVTALVRRYL